MARARRVGGTLVEGSVRPPANGGLLENRHRLNHAASYYRTARVLPNQGFCGTDSTNSTDSISSNASSLPTGRRPMAVQEGSGQDRISNPRACSRERSRAVLRSSSSLTRALLSEGDIPAIASSGRPASCRASTSATAGSNLGRIPGLPNITVAVTITGRNCVSRKQGGFRIISQEWINA